MFSRFSNAFQFLTVIPLFKAKMLTDEELAKSMAAFPLVGALLGLVCAAFHIYVGTRLNPLVEGIVIAGFLMWSTGGFHLDGLADTVDGLAGGWTRERALEIMKDSRVGSVGACALVFAILALCAGYGLMPEKLKIAALVGAPAIGRSIAVLVAFKSPNARGGDGLGGKYAKNLDAFTFALAFAFGLAASALAGVEGVAAFAALVLYGLYLKGFFKRRLSGVTGDILGFAEVTSEIFYLLMLQAVFAK